VDDARRLSFRLVKAFSRDGLLLGGPMRCPDFDREQLGLT
jgi:hypothetical protein